jgi:hypothetical protein
MLPQMLPLRGISAGDLGGARRGISAALGTSSWLQWRGSFEDDCYSVMAPEKELWRVVDVGAVSPYAW